jgi:autotransporter translocation and assembly factor TamB
VRFQWDDHQWSPVEGAAVDSSLLRFTVREGLARVDTFAIRTEVGTLRGRGGFGLAESRSAALYLTVDAPDLSTWNRWIVPGRNPVRPDTSARDLFALFPSDPVATEEGEEVDTAPPDSLAGSLDARGVLYGNLTSVGFGGSLSAAPVSYGETRADSLRLTLDASDARGLDSLVVSGDARGLVHGVQRADSASFRLERRGAQTSAVRVRAARGDRTGIRAGGTVTWTDERRAAELDDLELRLGGQRLRLEETATVAYGDSGLSVSGLSMTGERGTRIRASGDIPARGGARFDLELERVDLAELTELLAVGQGARGHLGGALAVRGTAASPRFDASFTVDSAGFEDRVYRRLQANLAYDDRRLSGHVGLAGGSGELIRLEGTVRADLAFREVERRLLEQPLDLTLSADSLPLELITLPLTAVRDVDGHGSGSVRITGSPDDPQMDGRISLQDGGEVAVDRRAAS